MELCLSKAGPSSNMTDIFIRGDETQRQRHMRRRWPQSSGGRDWGSSTTCQRMPKGASRYEEARKGSPLEPSERMRSCQHLVFRLPT